MSSSNPSPEAPRSSSGEQKNSRREALRTFGKVGLGAAALSFATFGPGVRKALAQDSPVGILNFALTLEYLEAAYYNEGLATNGLFDDEGEDVYTLIAEHENEHVDVLVAAINAAGGDPVGPFDIDDFDFTADGTFPDPFGNYDVYLALSQAFEDTGVRAYKGQAANIPADLEVAGFNALTTALQIHSVEARHAAEVRRIRASMGADVEPWISEPLAGFSELGLSDDAVDAVEAVYDGEDNTDQGGVNLSNALGDRYSDELIREAFDEPLSMDAVNAIAGSFLDPQE